MSAVTFEPGTTRNLFLDSLPLDSARSLLAYLELSDGPSGKIIAHAGMSIKHVAFPTSGVISAVTRMQDGTDVEVMLFGREGFFGLQIALSRDASGGEAMIQVPHSYLRMGSGDFRQCLLLDPLLNSRVLLYTQVMIETISQFSGCNRLHAINQRCARWLLMAHDRIDGDTISLTHEYLATMLGVRRPSVSLTAEALDRAGVIEYHRGRIIVRDRRGLEAMACECYRVANGALERLLGYGIAKHPTGS